MIHTFLRHKKFVSFSYIEVLAKYSRAGLCKKFKLKKSTFFNSKIVSCSKFKQFYIVCRMEVYITSKNL